MIESVVVHLETLKEDDYFEEFLVLLENEKKKGKNYLLLVSIPVALHYRLIQENFSIKRVDKTSRYLIFFKRNQSYFKVSER